KDISGPVGRGPGPEAGTEFAAVVQVNSGPGAGREEVIPPRLRQPGCRRPSSGPVPYPSEIAIMFRSFFRARCATAPAARKPARRSVPLVLEELEDRTVPSLVSVGPGVFDP